MATEELNAQIEQERKELEGAVKIPVSQFQPRAHGESGRCGWCGRWSDDLVIAEMHPLTGHVRYKGVQCCGGRHL